MGMDEVKSFAIKAGYTDIRRNKDWRGYKVYSPIYTREELSPGAFPPVIGLPYVILVKNGEIRMSTPEEAMARIGVSRLL